MKKNYAFKTLLLLPFVGFLFISNSNGYTSSSITGSPGDGGTTCTQCHGGGNFSASASVTSNIPGSGYQVGATYQITVTANSPNATKRGFQLTAENANNIKVGTFSASGNAQLLSGGKTVTHTTLGNTATSWTFDWTAPSADEGTITFYSAVNNTNGNGATSGDEVVTATLEVQPSLSAESVFSQSFKMYPNPAKNTFKLNLPQNITTAQVVVFDVMGRSLTQQTVSESNNTIDISMLQSGNYIVSIATDLGIATKKLVKK